MTTVNQARFTIDGTPSEDPVTGDPGYVAALGQTLDCTLEITPSSALSVTYSVFNPADETSPLASFSATNLTWVGSGLPSQTLTTPNATAQIIMPASGVASYLIRCSAACTDKTHIYERLVSLRTATSVPLRKTVPAETSQYYARGWSDEQNKMVDAISGGLNAFGSAGTYQGAWVTDAGGGSINIAAGTGFLRTTAAVNGVLMAITWLASPGVAIPADTVRYVGVEYNAGTPQAVVRVANTFNGLNDFLLATVYNEAGTLHILEHEQATMDGLHACYTRFMGNLPLSRDERVGGLIVGDIGVRNLTMNAGVLYDGLGTFAIAAIDTSVASTFDYYYRDGGVGWTKVAAQTQYSNSHYDDNTGVLHALTGGNYGITWWYLESDGHIVALYGQGDYASLVLAQASAAPATVPGRVDATGTLIGRTIILQGAAAATVVESVYTDDIDMTVVINHNSLAGLQGGIAGQYYHLSLAQHTDLTDGGLCTSHVHSLDQTYEAAVATVTADLHDITWNLTGAFSHVINAAGCAGAVDGVFIEDGTDYWRLTHAAANTLNLSAELGSATIGTSLTFELISVGVATINSPAGISLISDANDAGAHDFTIRATNAGAGTAILNIDAKDAITVDTGAGFSIDGVTASNVSTTTGTLTIDATAGIVNIARGAGGLGVNIGHTARAMAVDCDTILMTASGTSGNVRFYLNANVAALRDFQIYAENANALGARITFSDSWQKDSAGAGGYSTAMPFGTTAAEWTLFKTNFGEVSLLNAINQCAASAVTLDEAYNASAGPSAIAVDAGDVTWTLSGGSFFNVMGGNVGVGIAVPLARIHALATIEQLRLGYDAAKYTSFTTDINGDMTIAPTGGDVNVTGNLTASASVTGTATATGSASLGPELLLNGTFDSDLSNWTAGANWAWGAGGTADHTAGSVETLTQSLATTIGQHYQVVVVLSSVTASNVVMTLTGSTGYETFTLSAATTYTYSFKAGTNPSVLTFTPNTLFVGSITSVSLKLITPASTYALASKDVGGAYSGACSIANDDALFNCFSGVGCGVLNTTGLNNAGQGVFALYSNTTGSYNSAQGRRALAANTTGSYNSAQGNDTLFSNTTGSFNNAQGGTALYSNTTGSYGAAQGYGALYSNTTASFNTAQGYKSLYSLVAGSNTTAQGYEAGRFYGSGTDVLTSATQCLYLGASSRASADAVTNEIVIGYNAIGAGSNTATLGNTSVTRTQLRGNFGNLTGAYGTAAAGVLGLASGTAPTTSPADAVQLWAADRGGVGGKSALHMRTEDGFRHVFGDYCGLNTTTPAQLLDLQSGALRFDYVAAPSGAAVTFADGAAGVNTDGVHSLKFTAVNPLGETELGTVSPNYTVDTNEQIVASNCPISSDPTVTSRNVYACKAGAPTVWYLIAGLLPDNTTTSCTINVADASLVTAGLSYNTTSAKIYVGSTRVGMYDSNGNCVIGGSNAAGVSGINILCAGTTNILIIKNNGGSASYAYVNAYGVGVGTVLPVPGEAFVSHGDIAQSFSMRRRTTANTAGNTLSLVSSGCTVGATNKAGGNLLHYSGVSTGSGISSILFYAYPGIAAATTDNTSVDICRMDAVGIYVGPGTAAPTAYLHIKAGGSTAGTAPIKLEDGSTLAAAEQGVVEYYKKTLWATTIVDGSANVAKQSLDGALFSQSTVVTVSNTDAETTLIGAGRGSVVLPIGFFGIPGKKCHVNARGFFSSIANSQIVFRVSLTDAAAAECECATASIATGERTSMEWELDVEFVAHTADATAEIWGQGFAFVGATTTSSDVVGMPNLVHTHMDYSDAITVAITADWNNANAGNTISCTHITVTSID
jgi:hypothetical protein